MDKFFFLSQTNAIVKIKSRVSDSFSPTTGILHESVIAPILLLIYGNRFSQIKAQNSQFTDVFVLYYRSRSPKLNQKYLQSSLNSRNDLRDSLKIKINPNKTHYLIFRNTSKKESFRTQRKRSIYQEDTIDKFLRYHFYSTPQIESALQRLKMKSKKQAISTLEA